MNANPLALQLTLPAIVNNVLERQYLSNAEVLESFLQPDYQNITIGMKEMLALSKLQRLGVIQEGNSEQISQALRHALTGCYYPDVFQLCFLIESDGREISVHLGIRTPTHSHWGGSDDYLSNFTSVFQTECPGTRFSNIEPQSFTKRKYFAPVTGVPSELSSSNGSLEAFFAGMDGYPFSLMVVADPMPSSQIEQALFACREMLSQAETFKTFTQSNSSSYTQQISRQIAKTVSDAHSVSSSSSSKDKSGFGAVTAGVIATALIAPQMAPLVLMGGSLSLPNYTNGVSDSHTESLAKTCGEAITTGVTSGQSMNIVNSHIAEASEYLKKFSARLLEGKVYGAWNTSVYLMTDSPTALNKGGMLIRALFTGDESYIEPVRMHPIVMGRSKCDLVRDGLSIFSIPHWDIISPETHTRQIHPLGEAFSSLSTPLTSKELVRWLCLPNQDMPGLARVVHAQGFSVNVQTNNGHVNLGSNNVQTGAKNVQYTISPDALTRHTLIAGMTRSGKTNTCKQIVQELIRIKGGLFPFLIIEPAKTEYVDWALELNEKSPQKINVFMPGRKLYKGRQLLQLKLNPFEVVWENDKSEPAVSEHIQYLTAIINASLPMQESLPLLMEEAIYNCYAEETFPEDPTRKDSNIYQWITDGTLTKPAPWGTPFPTFKTLMKLAPRVVERKKYHSEANSGLMAALNTRIGSFLHPGLPKCECFLTDGKPVKGFWKSFFSRPTVINLSSIVGEEDKSFFMAVLLMFLYEYRRQENDVVGYSNELRHLLVIEEAHNILKRAQPQGIASIDSVGKASRMFSDFISEIGAYGQGVMIIDQSPEKLSPDAIKNTNLKIVHRLSYGADRQQMAVAMDLSATQERVIPTLTCGEAIVRTDEDDKPVWLKINRCTSNN